MNKTHTDKSKKTSPLERGMRGVSQSQHHIIIILFVLTLFASCKKQEVGPQCPTCQDEVIPTTTDILIGCEGNFGWGNASLSSYNPLNGDVTNQVFTGVNGFSLGDVLQDITATNGKLYVTMNNSGKIVVMDTSDYTFLGEIQGLNSPRFFEALNNSKGYVSDLYANSIQVINLSTNVVSSSIPTQRWTEHLLIHDDYLYASAPDTNWVFRINTLTNSIEDTITVGLAPSGMVTDKNDKMWILTSGGTNEELAKLVRYNPTSNVIEQTLTFNDLSESPGNLRIDEKRENIYFLNDGLQTMSIFDTSVPVSKAIPTNGSVFYGMNVDPINKDVYITDAVDYVQQGKVYRYDSIFQPLDTFTVGIIPQSIWFK